MRTGLSIPPFTEASTVLAMAADAEAAGWDGVFLWDHLQWETGAGLPIHDPWVLLGAIAARTERVMLGTLVTPLARRRPQVVAKQVTTLDHLSAGRAVLGVGLGAPSDADFVAFGDEGDERRRADMLDDRVAAVAAMLEGGVVRHEGPHVHVEADLLPAPVQQPRPRIWVAAVAPHRRPLARAARWDGVVPLGLPNGFQTPAEVTAYLAGVERPAGWDVVAARAPGVPADEYAAAGVTWLIDSTWPQGDWVDEFAARIRRGPET